MLQTFCLRLPSSEREKGLEERFAPSIDRAGVVIITKYGDPIICPMSVFTGLFWIILFPPQVLPYHLQIISYFLPQYYFFTYVRFVMTGWPITAILPEVLILAAMCGIMLPPGYFATLGALEKANNNGTLDRSMMQ